MEDDRFYSKLKTKAVNVANKPLSLCFHIGYKCNMKCYYCFAPFTEDYFIRLRTHELIERLNLWGKIRVVISGGEPFMYGDLLYDTLTALKESGHVTFVSTNGSLLNKLKNFCGLIDWLDISLPGSNREIYFKTRGEDTFDKVSASIKEAVNLGFRVRLSYLVCEKNISDVTLFPDYAIKLGVNNIRFSIEQTKNGEINTPSRLECFNFIREALNKYEGTLKIYYPFDNEFHRYHLNGYLVLEPDGSLYRSHVLPSNYLGNIMSISFDDNNLIKIYKEQVNLFVIEE